MSMIRTPVAHTRTVNILLVGIALCCLIPDPYTYGGVGGDRHNFDFHIWQIVATIGLVTFLIAGVSRKDRIVALGIYQVETLLFVTLNLIYVARDGFYTRCVVGDYGFPLPAVLLLIGLLVRLQLLMIAKGTKLHDSGSREIRAEGKRTNSS
jgi:hypothetical protein